jgi:hypothetical protein
MFPVLFGDLRVCEGWLKRGYITHGLRGGSKQSESECDEADRKEARKRVGRESVRSSFHSCGLFGIKSDEDAVKLWKGNESDDIAEDRNQTALRKT